MKLNLQSLQNIEVDVESLADAAVGAIPAVPSIFAPFLSRLLNVGLSFGFNWLNDHFGETPAANVTASATTHPPSATTTAAVANATA